MDKVTRYLLISITAGFLLFTLIKSFQLTKKYGGTDLRCRIVGSRLARAHKSAYFYKWNPADGVFYLDPNDDNKRLVNGNVVTPAVLTVIYPIARLSYPQVRWIWSILQVLAMFGSIYMLFKQKNILTTLMVASPLIIGIVCSDIWLYNIERGQMYVFYTFLFALMYYLYTSKLKHNEFLSGFVGGLFILFRPYAGVMGLGFLLGGRKKWIAGCLAGLVLGALAFVLPQRNNWNDYFSAMKEYVNEVLDRGHHNEQAIEPAKPVNIEGSTNITVYEYFGVGAINPYPFFLKNKGIIMDTWLSLIVLGLIIAILCFLFYRFRKKNADPEVLFLFGFFSYIVTELCMPAPRGAYNMIMWLFPLSLIYLRARSNWPVLIVLGLALLLLHDYPFYFPYQDKLPETLFLLLTLYWIFWGKPKSHVSPAESYNSSTPTQHLASGI